MNKEECSDTWEIENNDANVALDTKRGVEE